MKVVLLGLLLSVLCFDALSAGLEIDVSGVELVSKNEQQASAAPLALSAIKRVSNQLRIERQTDMGGTRFNYLYRVLSSGDLTSATAFYEALFAKHGKLVFSCTERNCGSSNDWANKVFGQRDLAGRDTNQRYLVGEIDDGIHQGWLSVYSVTNVRRQEYIYVSFIAAAPTDFVADLKRGVLVTDDGLSPDAVGLVSSSLTAPKSELVVMAFSKRTTDTHSESLARSENNAAVIGTRLKAQLGDAISIRQQAMGRLGQVPISNDAEEWAYLYLVD